ncbi:MAG: type II toxin-antitoxin system HicA family toxin [Actinomycetota bacterium]|nr:type II toxin-antitoxin system HicA family toxin [Actinomycetota bacterium]
MTARELRKLLRKAGCDEVRQSGSHLIVRCGRCQTTIPVHAGRDIAVGTLRTIARHLRPCLGDQEWMP